MSTLPCFSTAFDTNALAAAPSLTSSEATSALPPAAVISSTVFAAFCARAAATTVAPCCASLNAMARPIPRDAPVTSATRPDRLIIVTHRGASPLGLPYTLAPLRWLTRGARSLSQTHRGLPYTLARSGGSLAALARLHHGFHRSEVAWMLNADDCRGPF